MPTIFDLPSSDRAAFPVPEYNVADHEPLPDELLSFDDVLPNISEREVVRHYTALSQKNYSVDTHMYPLGSCTMKYNPKLNERIASFGGFTQLHPLTRADHAQGALEILWELSSMLSEITGMKEFSLAPAAGAHGELAGVMIIKKFFEEKGEKRRIILIPDSAHGTNPASVAMCGFEVRQVPSTREGDVDIRTLERLINDNVAAMMLTNPNTLGLFEQKVIEIASLLHSKGALFYADGANLNALMGKVKVRDMGFDLMHLNLHKTFSTPHGGGGPGAGPIGVSEELTKYLPVPVVIRDGDKFFLDYERKSSIGRIHSFYGNFLICVRAYAYLKRLGASGIKTTAETAVLNANYLRARLKGAFYFPVDRPCMHEFVITDKGLPHGITTNDIAKRILDYNFHAPTVYFPIHVSGAIMIEPTETESKQSLDAFADALLSIRKECEENPELVRNAPFTTPVKRVDAVQAARKPVLTWRK
ncbi:MAG: aminomethyl-transferring glycine dehydrogenase subunit GcvPB [Spirochaetes bacterium]|nr:aminomethyl-transferring glycine dehydrogenase subunit GcvPB [Spirochaetota bacterium]